MNCVGIVVSEILNVSYDSNLLPTLNELIDEVNYQEHERLGQEMYNSINAEQRIVVDAIPSSSSTNLRCFFIDGPGGSGKTYVYDTIFHILTSERVKVQFSDWNRGQPSSRRTDNSFNFQIGCS